MQKNDIQNIIYIIIGALVIALLINGSLTMEWELIPSRFTKEEWFCFWTTYATGVFAIIIGYCTIVTANRNSKQAILQQNVILTQQKSDEIYKEITDEIRRHISLFNIANFTSTTLFMNEENLSHSKEKVVEKKAAVDERQLQWNLINSLYLSSKTISPIAEDYNKVWNEATEKLRNYAITELNIYRVIEEIKQQEYIISNLDQLIIVTKERYGDDAQSKVSISPYTKQKEDTLKKQQEANMQYKNLVAEINDRINDLSISQEELFNASTKFLSQLGNYTFVKTHI